MKAEEVKKLLERYVSEELNREEFFALWQTISAEEHRVQWEEQMEMLFASDAFDELAGKQQQASILAGILGEEKVQTPVRRMPLKRSWWVAASVICMISIGAYLWFGSEKKEVSTPPVISARDIPPGKEGAILTLADGAQVVLDSAGNGLIATQNGSRIVLKNNEITYSPGVSHATSIVYNSLSTPNGRQFHVQLPDGTNVWLNAASSIKYPATFTGVDRKVSVTGEVYFEVAQDKTKPFIVDVDGKMNVQVLGTEFNVNAYSDEPYIGTSLLEGSIRLVGQSDYAQSLTGEILKPGQQARTTSAETKVIDDADLKMATAWKDGSFQFNYTPLKDILRQFARWYDVEVVYEQKVPAIVLTGAIKRDFSLSEALKTLEIMGLHYRVEGRKLIIMP